MRREGALVLLVSVQAVQSLRLEALQEIKSGTTPCSSDPLPGICPKEKNTKLKIHMHPSFIATSPAEANLSAQYQTEGWRRRGRCVRARACVPEYGAATKPARL